MRPLSEEKDAAARRVVKKLRPDQAKNALKAWRERERRGWENCPIAYALNPNGGHPGHSPVNVAANQIGVSVADILDVTAAFDDDATRPTLKGYFALKALLA